MSLEIKPSKSLAGWGLKNPDTSLFLLEKTNQFQGCVSFGCDHISHDPGEFIYKLTLVFGELTQMGMDCSRLENIYFRLPDGRFLRYASFPERHAKVSILKKLPSDLQLYNPDEDLIFKCPCCGQPANKVGYCETFFTEGSCLS